MFEIDEIKSQYARILQQKDWLQFSQIAEYYLKEAARLKTKHIEVRNNKLLLRNSIKRLYLGIGCELLIKSFYLKKGYCINRFKKEFTGEMSPTHKLSDLNGSDINDKDTFTLSDLINNLNKIKVFDFHVDIERGFKIAMVFRNKEAHVTHPTHEFNEQNYRDIENAVKNFYKEAFSKRLTFIISMKPNENYAFKVSK